DESTPVERAIGDKVFVGIPECAVVARIDAHGCVVSPTRETGCLRTATLQQTGLGSHRACRIGRRAAGITDRRMDAAARRTVAESDVSCLIHRSAAHPSIRSIRRTEGSLLKYAEVSSGRYRCT